MKLQTIFDYLTSGELSQLSIGGGEPGQIREADYRKVTQSINLGLSQLHTRFALREGTLKLVLIPGLYLYSLTGSYASSNQKSKVAVRYIDDSGMPFLDDVAKVLKVQTDSGVELALDNRTDPLGCNVVAGKTLSVPKAIVDQSSSLPDELKTDFLTVTYRAEHPVIDTSEDADIDPSVVEVDLPYSFLEPLLYFVASRAHFPVSLGSEINPATSYYAKYEQACALLEAKNMDLDSFEEGQKFRLRGFV